MKWIKIDPENLPKGEILAANFNSNSMFFKGKIVGNFYKGDSGRIQCESDEQVLWDCTHYIDIHKFDPVENKWICRKKRQ